MTVRVLFFSVLKDITGADEVLVTCGKGSTMGALLETLFERWPSLRAWDGSLLLALDQRYVKCDAELHEEAEVAVMPPVQGG
ncbi:MAG: MoaD/ThiS family protein [Prosthecobacter sp.]